MLITRLILEGFKRTSVIGVENIDISFHHPYQVIIGTNGAGKSNLLKQLIPNIPDRDDFHVNGRKELHLSYNGKTYVIMTSFGKRSSSHDFFIDGVNMNSGGTATVQKDLIREHFSLTPTLIEVLMGSRADHRFTTMTKEKRKEIFTLLAPTDLTFANKLYKSIQTSHRDAVGVISYLKGRIGQEQVKIITDEESTALLNELTDRELIRSHLLERRGGLTGILSEERIDVVAKMAAVSKAIEDTKKITLKDYQYRSTEAMNDEIQNLRVNIGLMEEERKGKMSNLEKITGLLNGMEEQTTDYDSLIDEMKELEMIVSYVPDDPLYDETIKYIEGFVEQYEQHRSDIEAILYELRQHYDSGYDFSHVEYEALSERIAVVEGQCARAKQTLHSLECRLEEANITKDTNCPKCKHIFKVGFEEGEVDKTTKRIQNGNEIIERLSKEISELNEKFTLYRDQRGLLASLHGIAERVPYVKGLINGLFNAEVDKRIDDSTWRVLASHLFTQQYRARVAVATKRLASLTKMREYVDSLNAITGNDIHGTYKALEAGIAQIGVSIMDMKQRIQTLTKDIEDITYLRSVNEKVQSKGLPLIEKGMEDEMILSLIKEIGELIDDNQSRITFISSRLDESNVAKRILEELTNNLADKEKEQAGYATLLDVLSPKTGLIAEQLSGFVVLFTESMNKIIESIYSYPLHIVPCGMGDGELDYQFPFVAHNGDMAPDVSVGSWGQQELFDFVFMLTVNIMLNKSLPLWLDELGAFFDDYHRNRIMEYVKDLVNDNTPTVFWISQRATDFLGSNNSEVLVLGSGNVSLPTRYNQHVTMS